MVFNHGGYLSEAGITVTFTKLKEAEKNGSTN